MWRRRDLKLDTRAFLDEIILIKSRHHTVRVRWRIPAFQKKLQVVPWGEGYGMSISAGSFFEISRLKASVDMVPRLGSDTGYNPTFLTCRFSDAEVLIRVSWSRRLQRVSDGEKIPLCGSEVFFFFFLFCWFIWVSVQRPSVWVWGAIYVGKGRWSNIVYDLLYIRMSLWFRYEREWRLVSLGFRWIDKFGQTPFLFGRTLLLFGQTLFDQTLFFSAKAELIY